MENNLRESFEESIARQLQGFMENKVTREYIIPLLKSLGYQRVEFFGGSNEEGKDIIMWEIDKLGDIKLAIAQVKHFKFDNTASSNASLQTVVNQLIAASVKPLTHLNKNNYLPDELILISTYPLDTKTLQTRFSQHPSLIDRKIKIIDGIRLVELLRKHKPQLIQSLIGLRENVSHLMNPTLNNDIVLKALGYQGLRDLKSIHTDIDFSLGKHTTRLFFNAHFKPISLNIKLKHREWLNFKKILESINDQFTEFFCTPTIVDIDKNYADLKDKISRWKVECLEIEKRIEKKKNEIQKLALKYEKKEGESYKAYLNISTNESKEIDQSTFVDNSPFVAVNQKSPANEMLNKLLTLESEYSNLSSQLEVHLENEPSPNCEINIDGKILASQLLRKRNWIESKVQEFNLSSPSVQTLSEFIDTCNKILVSAGIVLSDNRMHEALGYDSYIIRTDFESTRFKLPIQQVFDTGRSLTVLGEAGAGKTTSLQIYALTSNRSKSKTIICVLLAQITQHLKAKEESGIKLDKRERFEDIIAQYLIDKGVDLTIHQFEKEIRNGSIVLLLDGIDEAIKLNPWLPSAIRSLSERYGNVLQIIVTSRMSGSYVDQLPFFSFTLLPFTDKQRDEFISKWFNDSEAQTVERITKHLHKHKALGEVVRSPLLATTLCTLAKHDIELPITEVRLYEDRIKLFTGYYDRAKNIDVRMDSRPQILEEISQKLAFHLHKIGRRDDTLENLISETIQVMKPSLSAKHAAKAVEELIDPCNILVPMSEDGKYGFGHLRYQEHLAAKQLLADRGIDVMSLLSQNWWSGVFVLLSRMSTDISWIINLVGLQMSVSKYEQVLHEMILARDEKDQPKLRHMLRAFLRMERGDFELE